MKNTIVLLACSFLLCALSADAQYKKRDDIPLFGLAVTGGINSTQLDGDFTQGYKQKGIYGGLVGLVNFSHRLRGEIGLIYAQKGSRWEDEANGFDTQSSASLAFEMVEVPITIRYFPKGQGAGLYYEGGVFIGQLLERTFEQDFTNDRSDRIYEGLDGGFKKGEFGIVGGAGLRLKIPVSIGIRFTAAVTKIMDLNLPPVSGTNVFQDRQIGILRNYGFTILTAYEF